MTDNEIMAAIKGCIGHDYDYCDVCPYSGCDDFCDDAMMCDVLALINRKNAEIEELEAVIKDLETEIDKQYEQAKADIIKEFADVLKKNAHKHSCRYGGYLYDISAVETEDIDLIAKGLVGDAE